MPKYWQLAFLLPTIGAAFLQSGIAQSVSSDRTQLYGDLLQTKMQVASLEQRIQHLPAEDSYVVRYGDTLHGVARKHGVSYQALKSANGLTEPNPLLREGQRLRIPPATASRRSSVASGSGERFHTVQANETLSKIARQHGVEVADIVQANNIADPNSLSRGTRLRIPGSGASVRQAPAARPKRVATMPPAMSGPGPWPPNPNLNSAPAAAPRGHDYYQVQPGDTTQSIARTYRITTQELLRINRIRGPNYQLRPGESLLVPTPGGRYVPNRAPGAAPINAAPAPVARRQAVPPPMAGTPAPAASTYTHIRVAPGDSLESLAQRYNTSVARIVLDNPGIRSNADMRVGEEMRILTAIR